jgi:hypothetical protein
MTQTNHRPSTRTIVLSAAVGLALAASIASRADGQSSAPGARPVAESRAVAVWARNEGLSGLSPASLSVAPGPAIDLDARVQLERTAIAVWARNEGLGGLSPTSLGPTANQ